MSEIFVTGHRNPDMDSVCAAYAYARLKNITDPKNIYVDVRCGQVGKTVKLQFEQIGAQLPQFKKDVVPTVGDVMRTTTEKLSADYPVYDLMKIYKAENPSALPLFKGDLYAGLLSIDDITGWLLADNGKARPKYRLSVRNIEMVDHATTLKRGEQTEFDAEILIGSIISSSFGDLLANGGRPAVVMTYRRPLMEMAMKAQVPVILLCETDTLDPDLDTSAYRGSILVTKFDIAESIRRMRMSPPVRHILGKQGKPLEVTDTFDEAQEALEGSDLRGLSVFDNGEWVGFVTRRCFLRKPRYKVIMVDHNEPAQSIKGIDGADVVEIIDHHRLAASKTDLPIFIDAEPLGSTCTIVTNLYRRNGVTPDATTAKVLLSGILADTLVFRSPTTTAVDREAGEYLGKVAGVDDIGAFGESMFSMVESLADQNPSDVICADFKAYSEMGVSFGIGQCEVPTLKGWQDYEKTYRDTLEELRHHNGLDWTMIMVTDVFKEESILICTSAKAEGKLPYAKLADHVFEMPGVLSRKKQLLPEILHAIEQTGGR